MILGAAIPIFAPISIGGRSTGTAAAVIASVGTFVVVAAGLDLVYILVAIFASLAAFRFLSLPDPSHMSPDRLSPSNRFKGGALFFLFHLPLRNALADFVSIAATRLFLRNIASNARHPMGAAVGGELLGVAIWLSQPPAC